MSNHFSDPHCELPAICAIIKLKHKEDSDAGRKDESMHALTELIRNDMKPALGVTEPAAIAFAVAAARQHAKGAIKRVTVRLNSGMYKNAFTCGIPGSDQVGNLHAAALGAVGADPSKGLECLEGITKAQNIAAQALVEEGKVRVEMSRITSRIRIDAEVSAENGSAVVMIRDGHTNIVTIKENDTIVFETEDPVPDDDVSGVQESSPIHLYSMEQLYRYAATVPLEEIAFIRDAYDMNLALFYEGQESGKTVFGPYLLAANGGKVLGPDEQKTASLLCCGAIEARVLGLSRPAMSITGSGAHGIIATLPLYAAYKVRGYTEEALLRATALSYLVCMFIKEYSGKLSAFCGCAIAAGTGMACGIVFLRGGSVEQMAGAINNMAGSITGMICDGGNQGCTMKGVVAVDAAYQSVNMAMAGVSIAGIHGIAATTPEEAMRNMGLVASPGMEETEKTILEILKRSL